MVQGENFIASIVRSSLKGVIEMVYLYEIIHDFSGVMPDVVGNWEFTNEKFDEDDGSEEFILTNFDPEKHE